MGTVWPVLCFFNHVKCFSLALLRAQPSALLADGNPNEKPACEMTNFFTGVMGEDLSQAIFDLGEKIHLFSI